MTILFVILIIIAAFVLGLIVLIQNPKGGGLAGNIGGFSTQFMGVKQTTDVLEKGTWIFAAVIGVLCLFSVFFVNRSGAIATPSVNPTDVTLPSSPARPGTPSNATPFPSNTVPSSDSPGK